MARTSLKMQRGPVTFGAPVTLNFRVAAQKRFAHHVDVERDRGDAILRTNSSRRSKEGWSTRIEQVRPRESEKEHPVASVVSLSSFTFEGTFVP